MPKIKHCKAQMIAEYAIIIAVVASAIMAMSYYVKRGLSGQIKSAHDFMVTTAKKAHQNSGAVGEIHGQYEPYYSLVQQEVAQDSTLTEHLKKGDHGGTSGIYEKILNHKTDVVTEQEQLPPGLGGYPQMPASP